MSAGRKSKAGFTLVELLAVMAIIAILISLLVPAVNAVRERARSTQCSSNLRNVALAILNYETAHKVFPINWGSTWDTRGGGTTKGQSWVTLILPQLDSEPLYKRIKFGEKLSYRESNATATSGKDNTMVARMAMRILCCPSDTHQGLMGNQKLIPNEMVGVSNYKACLGGNWNSDVFKGKPPIATKGRYTDQNRIKSNPWDYNNGVIPRGGSNVIFTTSSSDIKDGTSNTICVGETIPALDTISAWFGWHCASATTGVPLNWDLKVRRVNEILANADRYWFMSRHPGGANFAFADGSMHWLAEGIERETYIGLGSIDGEELLGDY